MDFLPGPAGFSRGFLPVYTSPIVRQRRRQRVLFAALIAIGLVVCLLPAPDNKDGTATASVAPVAVPQKGVS